MIIQDDRTPEQKLTHLWGIVATDLSMSYWGECPNGKSIIIWALENYSQAEIILEWVKTRPEMKRPALVNLKNYRIRYGQHCHIYVTNGNHPVLTAYRVMKLL